MRAVIAGLWFASTLATGTAVAQPFPFNDVGSDHGSLAHRVARRAGQQEDLRRHGRHAGHRRHEAVVFPGVRINLTLGNMPGSGGSVGSVVNHVGFIVNNVQEQVAKWKAAGVTVLPGGNNRLDQAFVETPDGLRIEILEDKAQADADPA